MRFCYAIIPVTSGIFERCLGHVTIATNKGLTVTVILISALYTAGFQHVQGKERAGSTQERLELRFHGDQSEKVGISNVAIMTCTT